MKTATNSLLKIHAAGAAIVFALIVFVYSVGIRNALQSRRTLRDARAESRELYQIVHELNQQGDDLEANYAEVIDSIQSKYDQQSEPGLGELDIVAQRLSALNLDLDSLREASGSAGAQKRIELRISGTYESIVRLLHELRRLDRPVRITALNLQPVSNTENEFAASLSLDFFAAAKLPSLLSAASDTES